MSVSTIGQNAQSQALWQVLRTQSVSGTETTERAAGGSLRVGGVGRDRAEISPMAQQFSDLAELQEADPEKFKELVTQMSENLRALADESTDPEAQTRLTEMADRFSAAAESGEVRDLMPPPPPQGAGQGFSWDTGEETDAATLESLLQQRSRPAMSDELREQLDSLFEQFGSQVTAALSGVEE